MTKGVARQRHPLFVFSWVTKGVGTIDEEREACLLATEIESSLSTFWWQVVSLKHATREAAVQSTDPGLSLPMLASFALSCVMACGAPCAHASADQLRELPSEPAGTYFAWTGAEGDEAAARLSSDRECAACHQEQWQQWRGSTHHYASLNNPWYRDSLEGLRERAGDEAMRMCGGCHDPAMLPTEALLGTWEPESPLAHAGVSCVTCHRATHVGPEGNASLNVDLDYVLPGPTASDEVLSRHARQMNSETFESSRLCVSCHRGVLSEASGNAHILIGMNDASDWANSDWAGQGVHRFDETIDEQDCISCHMPELPDGGRDHHFRGAHTLMAAAREDEHELAALEEFLSAAVELRYGGRWDVASSQWDTSVRIPDADERQLVAFYLRNVGAGHRFPGGTLDAQGARIEVSATWYEMRISELMWPRIIAQTDSALRWVRAEPVDDEGRPHTNHPADLFSSVAWNTTIPARDAQPILVEVPALPSTHAKPAGTRALVVRARLLHERHRPEFAERVCERSEREPEFRAFEEESQRRDGWVVDPCRIPEPVVLAAAETVFSAGSSEPFAVDSAHWWAFALALSNVRVERLDYASAALDRCELLSSSESLERARCSVARAHIFARQGRRDDVVALLEPYLAAGHPAERSARWALAQAHAQVWDWSAVREVLSPAYDAGSRNTELLALLARASGVLGEHDDVVRFAGEGLRANPWYFPLRRSLVLSVPELADGLNYLAFRNADMEHARRSRCWERDPNCLAQSLPGEPFVLRWR